MAESSLFWQTNGTGDGAASYTQSQLFQWLNRTFMVDSTQQGVLAGYANKLAVSGTASPISVASGAAYVNGIPYENTAAVSVAVPTPSSGTTGYRVVLRANWSAQTVRVTLLASADGTATAPVMTQTNGTLWDISLATLTITTGGVITVTDTRQFVAETLYNRKGGDATNWNTVGTTNYTIPTATRIQAGVVSCPAASHTTVTFPVAFSGTPLIFLMGSAGVSTSASLDSLASGGVDPSGSQFSINILIGSGGPYNIQWFAIGPA